MNVDENQLIVDNAMKSTGCNSEAELARMMGMLPQNFNQKKKRGTIAKAINRFLEKTGQPAASTPAPIPSVSCPADADPNVIGKAGIVLGSGTIYGQALKQNIEAFYQAVQKEVKIGDADPLKSIGGTG